MIIADTLLKFCGVVRAFTRNASRVTFGRRGSVHRSILPAWSKRYLGSFMEGSFVDPYCCHKYLCDPLFLLHITSFRIWMKGVSTESATLIFRLAGQVLIAYVEL